jgi:DNA-binding transcriptional regulator YdaS (Cro superfamily)
MNAQMIIKSPLVRVADAIDYAGNQANLARILSITSASVSEWVSSGREYVPELQAWKLASVKTDLDVSRQ